MRRARLVRLLAYVRPYLPILLLAVLFSAAYSAGRMGRTYLLKPLLDDVLPAAADSPGAVELGWPGLDRVAAALPEIVHPAASATAIPVGERFWALMLAGVLVVIWIPLAHAATDYTTEWVLGRVLVDIQQQMADKFLALPLGFHHELRRGEALTRTLSDGLRAHASLRILARDVIEASLAIAASLATLFVISWQLALLVVALAPVLVGVVAAFGRRIRRTARRRQETTTEVIQRLVQILSGIKIIKAFRAERFEREAFARENTRLFRRSLRVVKNRVLSRGAVEGVTQVAGLAVLGIGTWVALNGTFGLTSGALAAFVTVMITAQRSVRELTNGWTQLQDALPSAQRYFELLDRPREAADPPDAVEIDGVREGIRFRGVDFSYGREPVLRAVSLDVRAGEVVALVGRTGAGKTTLVDLLLRFYEPDAGTIEIDGVDLRRIARPALLRHVAVVTQEPFLFEGTIRDNIRYGRPDATEAETEAAARAAHVDEFVAALPDGYDTQVGEAGVKLSGGQRQRVTIARALLRDPALLIFDEATSSLDAKSERLVQDAIDRLLHGRTVIVIAHRLSTVRRADRIVVLERGAVTQVGTHEELLAAPGLYRELIELQTGAAEAEGPGV
jgi:subfamily B ATP-binding cassette protein MsbA